MWFYTEVQIQLGLRPNLAITTTRLLSNKPSPCGTAAVWVNTKHFKEDKYLQWLLNCSSLLTTPPRSEETDTEIITTLVFTSTESRETGSFPPYHGLICVLLELHQPDPRYILHIHVAVGALRGIPVQVRRGGRRGDSQRFVTVNFMCHYIMGLK